MQSRVWYKMFSILSNYDMYTEWGKSMFTAVYMKNYITFNK